MKRKTLFRSDQSNREKVVHLERWTDLFETFPVFSFGKKFQKEIAMECTDLAASIFFYVTNEIAICNFISPEATVKAILRVFLVVLGNCGEFAVFWKRVTRCEVQLNISEINKQYARICRGPKNPNLVPRAFSLA